ncbi:MAG: trigger factor [Polyangiales bacterium]
MDVQVAQLTPVLVELSVTVESDRVKKEVDKAFVELQKRARVKGFRPGKAPREVLAHLYGGSVTSDVYSKLVDETLNQAITEKNVQPLNQPKIEVQSAAASAPLHYKARFEVRPVIDGLKWEGLEAEKPKVIVDDKALDETIEKLRKAHAQVSVPDPPRAAIVGDVVTIDFSAQVEGKLLDSGKGVTADLGEGKLVKELEDAVIGANPGDEKDVVVNFPSDHANPLLRGKQAQFHIKIMEVKERRLAALDDEFAKDVGDFADLTALRADAKEKLQKQLEEDAEQQLVTGLVAALCNANQVVAPPSLVEQQMQLTLQELQATARRNGQKVQLNEELQRQLAQDSDVKVRAGLLMAEIAKVNNITIDEKDIEKGLEELSKETGKNVARLRAEYRDPQRRQMLIGMILEDKVLDLMISKANVKEVDAKPAA